MSQEKVLGNGVINPSQYRHPKEQLYFIIAAVVGGLVWAGILFAASKSFIVLFYLLFLGALGWFSILMFKAYFFGNAVQVSDNQSPEIYREVRAMADKLGMKEIPYVFIVNGQGSFNAFALKFVGRGYVVLMSDLVNHYLEANRQKELHFVIAHELAHHAAGHTTLWKNLLIGIATKIPFLGTAYGRACEYTCDRAGALAIEDKRAAESSLLSLAHGTKALQDQINVDQFLAQEKHIPSFFGFILEIYSSHPRITRRVQAVRDFLK